MFKQLNFSTLSNFLLMLIVGWLLYQRVPTIIEMFQRQGQKAPPVKVQTLDGAQLSLPLSQKHLLVFWATWCGPCKMELARINSMIKAGTLSPDKVVAVSSSEDLETVRRFARENDYRFTVAIDPDGISARQFKVSGTPTLLLINESGNIEWLTMGVSPSLELRLKSFFKN